MLEPLTPLSSINNQHIGPPHPTQLAKKLAGLPAQQLKVVS